MNNNHFNNCTQSREQIAEARAKVLEEQRQKNNMRGLSKDSAIGKEKKDIMKYRLPNEVKEVRGGRINVERKGR